MAMPSASASSKTLRLLRSSIWQRSILQSQSRKPQTSLKLVSQSRKCASAAHAGRQHYGYGACTPLTSVTLKQARECREGLPTAARRAFSATAARPKDHHFDTLKFVQRLKDEGLTEEQAVAMMKVLSDVIEESIQNLTRTMVLREDQERATYTQKVDFAKLRSELLTADSTEMSLTRASHERLTNEIAKLNSRLRDEIQRTQASVRLDLNLEKGRIREEANVQELKLKETETRIEQETAVLREKLEAVKFTTLQWLMGVCTGTAALILGAWRLLM
ncbi:Protein FMP32, mitochondrial [Diplodia seriata]|uniref:Protein FMP32, mitochondrial n=1 Tax=Diplodia seriata TaxID=420778 RepID=A0A1S8B1D9_9PEZI|nr:Protein FMP32, mitochondrial [Diplodia seriata]